jgi:hypothetical protein
MRLPETPPLATIPRWPSLSCPDTDCAEAHTNMTKGAARQTSKDWVPSNPPSMSSAGRARRPPDTGGRP